jgi:DNA-binding response OmpR family regulator
MHDIADLRVLLIDDDAGVRARVRDGLVAHGMTVDEAADGEQGLVSAFLHPPDLVILDLMLPGMTGLAVLECLRAHRDVPVIALSGLSDEADRVRCLELGADDYIVKPFSPRELLARIGSVLRRTHCATLPDSPQALDFGPLVIDLGRRQVLVDGEPVELTRREFDLLAFLASAPHQAFTRAQLLDQVWASSPDWQNDATVTEHIHRLRQRLHLDQRPTGPHIVTVRGIGYRFEPGARSGSRHAG